MSFLERRTVSRKTAGDGRLEITKESARRIEPLQPLVVRFGGGDVPAELGTLPCTCRGEDNPHVHYFVRADRFRDLTPGSHVDLSLDEPNRRLALEPTQD
jgi:hypothetical protein